MSISAKPIGSHLQKETDFNQLLSLFNTFEKKYLLLVEERTEMEHKVDSLKEQCKLKDTNEKFIHEEMQKLEKINSNFQKLLKDRSTIEEENWDLKEKILNLKKDIKDHKKVHEGEIEKWKKILASQKQENDEHHQQQLKQQRFKLKQEIESLKESVCHVEAEMETLRLQLREEEKSKHTEMAKLKLEYDTKLMRLQQEKVKAQQQVTSSSSVGSSIFRQKLLNAKAASDKEIASLKRTVSDLQRKLDSQSSSKKKR